MARDTFTTITGGMTSNATDQMAVVDAVARIERSVAFAAYVTATTATGNITLDDTSDPVQSINCNGANRSVTLPNEAATNGVFFIINRTTATYILTVKDSSSKVICVVYPGKAVIIHSDGTGWHRSGGHHVTYTILTSGSGTYTVPDGVTALEVELLGGGGGGGGADGGSSTAGTGGGGGAGGRVKKYYATVGASYAYAVGAKGTGGAAGNNSGNNGGDSTFDTGGALLTAGGGVGGASQATGTSAAGALGGTGGTASGGDIDAPGAPGMSGFRIDGTFTQNGMGASSAYGGGGQQLSNANSDGVAGTGYGTGGSGGRSNTVTDRAGGDGTAGIIIVREIRE